MLCCAKMWIKSNYYVCLSSQNGDFCFQISMWLHYQYCYFCVNCLEVSANENFEFVLLPLEFPYLPVTWIYSLATYLSQLIAKSRHQFFFLISSPVQGQFFKINNYEDAISTLSNYTNGCSSTLTGFSSVFNLFSHAPSRTLSSTATLPSSRFTYNKVFQKKRNDFRIHVHFCHLLKKINML